MLSRTLTFSPDQDQGFFQELPAAPAVFLLKGDGEPYISKSANLRRRLVRLLGPPREQRKRLNLRDRVREVEFTATGSDFESQFLLYQLLRSTFQKTYAARLRLRFAPLIKLHLENEYPRASVTRRLGPLSGKNLYYGPFPSRAAAEKFASDALDFFKMRRCVDDLHPDPAFPGCVYSEMKMCLAPCFKGCTDSDYHAEVARVQAFFASGGNSLARELAQHRDHASTELAFEDAAAVHAKIEKLKPLLAQLPAIVRRIDQLAAIIIQPSAVPGSVSLFRFSREELGGPVIFSVDPSPGQVGTGAPSTSSGQAPGCPVEPSSTGASGIGPVESGLRPGGQPGAAVPTNRGSEARSLESRIEESIQSFAVPKAKSALERMEHLAILKRWYYRSSRIGEIFFADERGAWPLRRIVRGIGRVYHGERPQELATFSATGPNVAPS